MTHPFHPLAGRDFEFVEHRQNWGEDRVCLHDEDGQLFSLPVGFQNSATGPDLGFYAARSYSLMRPPRTGRRRIRSLERSAME